MTNKHIIQREDRISTVICGCHTYLFTCDSNCLLVLSYTRAWAVPGNYSPITSVHRVPCNWAVLQVSSI